MLLTPDITTVSKGRNVPSMTEALAVWLFDVAIYEGNARHMFTARTDMTWKDFRDRVVARLDAMDVRLVYRLNVDTRAWLDLSCEADMTKALTQVGGKALVARTREVSMGIKNMVSNGPSMTNDVLTFFFWLCLQIPKARGPEKGKRTRADNIPPKTPAAMVEEVAHLRDLQECLLCAAVTTYHFILISFFDLQTFTVQTWPMTWQLRGCYLFTYNSSRWQSHDSTCPFLIRPRTCTVTDSHLPHRWTYVAGLLYDVLPICRGT